MTYDPSQDRFPTTDTSVWAIVSLISGIASFTVLPMLGTVVAFIAGYAAKKEIRESNGRLGGDGLATAGLVMAWVNTALTALLCVLIGLIIAGVIGGVTLCGPLTGFFESIGN